MTPIEWARDAARKILDEFGNTASIDTANYQLCGFIIEAARLALEDAKVARRIGERMEPEREL